MDLKKNFEISVQGLKFDQEGYYVPVTLLESPDASDSNLLVLKDVVLMVSGVSSNRRWYRTKAVEKAVRNAQRYVQEMRFYGEYNHISLKKNEVPSFDSVSHGILNLRAVRIPDNVIQEHSKHNKLTFSVPEKYFVAVLGDVVLLPTQWGEQLRRIVESGFTISFSLSGEPVKTHFDRQRNLWVVDEFIIRSFDAVTYGGFDSLVMATKEDARNITPEELSTYMRGVRTFLEGLKQTKRS